VRALGCLALCLALCLAGGCGARAPARPSVILISIDTLRADHLGLYGYGRDTSPFLDRFARQCTVFERAHAPCAWTLSSHMTMLTGLFPAQHGVVEEDVALNDGIPTLAERLHDVGYQTVGLYRQSWVHERHGFARGFDVFRAHVDVEEAGAHLDEELGRLDPERPLFLFVHLYDVHNAPAGPGQRPLYPGPKPFQDLFLTPDAAPLPELSEEKLWETANLLGPAELETVVALYDGGIRHVDTRLSEWFEELERAGWLANTLVVITSDHGEALGQRGRLDGHGGFAEEGLHVPLLVRRPDGHGAGTRNPAVVHLGDLVPTVLSALGLPADERLPGTSLLGPIPDERVLVGSYTYPPSGYVLRWPEKIMEREGGRCLAVDLAQDPGELALRPARRERYRELFGQAFHGPAPLLAPRSIGPLPEDERAELRALGYGGEGAPEPLNPGARSAPR